MLLGALKATPFAAAAGAISIRDAAAYAAIASMVAGILIVGLLLGAAKAWRERAEARTDEAEQLEARMVERDEEIATLAARIAELELRPDLRGIRKADAEEHAAIVAAIERLSGSFGAAIEGNTTALKTIAENIPWGDLVANKKD